MKKRYLFIYLLLILLLTGCNAKYSLEIKNGIIKETLRIVENSDSDSIYDKDEFGYSFYDYAKKYGEEENIDTGFDEYYSMTKCQSDCSFYEKKFINDDGVLGFELSHEFTFEEYTYSSIANEIIPGFIMDYDGRYLSLTAGPYWTYFESYGQLEKIDLSIDTNYSVVSTNLKKIGAGKYEWKISEDSGKLYITLDTANIVDIVSEKDNNTSNFILILIISVGVLIVALIVCSISNRKKYR